MGAERAQAKRDQCQDNASVSQYRNLSSARDAGLRGRAAHLKEAGGGGKAPLPALTENVFLVQVAKDHFRERMSARLIASLPGYLPESGQVALRQLRRQCQSAGLEPCPAVAIAVWLPVGQKRCQQRCCRLLWWHLLQLEFWLLFFRSCHGFGRRLEK